MLAVSFVFTSPCGADKPRPMADVDEVYPFVPDWSHARVLHIGDSHVFGGYKAALAARLREAGAVLHQEMWVGSRSKSWVVSGKAVRLMNRYKPNVVIVTLGTNIIKYEHPERELSWVRALIERIDQATCYWIGPPPLIPDYHGYNDLMKENTAPCRYFDSRALDFPPRKDAKFHLSRAQGEQWAEQVWRFMNGR